MICCPVCLAGVTVVKDSTGWDDGKCRCGRLRYQGNGLPNRPLWYFKGNSGLTAIVLCQDGGLREVTRGGNLNRDHVPEEMRAEVVDGHVADALAESVLGS